MISPPSLHGAVRWHKDSGLGRGNDIDSVREYLQTKSIWIKGAVAGNPFVPR